jgi:hypothetical protein
VKKATVFITTLFLLAFTGCETDFEVLAPYKETMVVFGLLDQNDTAQYIKINKAFLGKSDALVMAQQYDSVNYGNELSVKVEIVKNGSTTGLLNLNKDSLIAKEAGIFNAPKQVLFKTKDILDASAVYRLTATNIKTGYTITAETPLISGFSIKFPTLPAGGATGTFDFANTLTRKSLQWYSGANGRLYQATIRFHYTEKNKITKTVEKKYVDWVFSAQKSNSTNSGELMEVTFMGPEFYQFLLGTIPVNNDVWRYPKTLDFIFSVASEQFNTYMEVNAPATGIVRERPIFSNINNGIGLFSARLRDTSRKNFKLNSNSEAKLLSAQYSSLGFCDSTICN